MFFETLRKWIRQLRGKDLPSARAEPDGEAFEDFQRKISLRELRTRGTIKLPKAGMKASQKGYGKFMKNHGKQTKEYRASVKAKVKPEEN